jgi:hypothetical protein
MSIGRKTYWYCLSGAYVFPVTALLFAWMVSVKTYVPQPWFEHASISGYLNLSMLIASVLGIVLSVMAFRYRLLSEKSLLLMAVHILLIMLSQLINFILLRMFLLMTGLM